MEIYKLLHSSCLAELLICPFFLAASPLPHTISSTVLWNEEMNIFSSNRHRKRVHCSHHCKLLALLELAVTSSFSHIIYVYVQREKIADSLPDPNNRRRCISSCVNCNHHWPTIIVALANVSDCVRERVNLLVGIQNIYYKIPMWRQQLSNFYNLQLVFDSSLRFCFSYSIKIRCCRSNSTQHHHHHHAMQARSSRHWGSPISPASTGIGRSSWARQEKKSSQRSCVVRSVEYMRQQRWRHNIFKRNSESLASSVYIFALSDL